MKSISKHNNSLLQINNPKLLTEWGLNEILAFWRILQFN